MGRSTRGRAAHCSGCDNDQLKTPWHRLQSRLLRRAAPVRLLAATAHSTTSNSVRRPLAHATPKQPEVAFGMVLFFGRPDE
jgi:hypothetical protein